MIHIEKLRFSYPGNDFSLAIDQLQVDTGEKLAVIGPSGSGKTTLLKLIAGIFLPEQGVVNVNEIEVNAMNDRKRRAFRVSNIGFIFQEFALLEYLKVRDNILHPYRISNILKLNTDARGRAKWLAEQMGIDSKMKRYPGDLSHGERQRVAICRALVTEPKLILADEATGNLDPVNKQHTLDLLFNIVQQQNTTLLAVTHDHELLQRFDRVIDFKEFHSNLSHA